MQYADSCILWQRIPTRFSTTKMSERAPSSSPSTTATGGSAETGGEDTHTHTTRPPTRAARVGAALSLDMFLLVESVAELSAFIQETAPPATLAGEGRDGRDVQHALSLMRVVESILLRLAGGPPNPPW